MSNETKPNIQKTIQQSSCNNSPALGCKTCCRLPGIPILPFRYTTCLIDDNREVTEVPEDIKKSIIPLPLEQYANDDEEIKNGAPLNKYILKKLRKGYLYLYDEIYGGQWQCFGIYSNGEMTPFPSSSPIHLNDLNNFCCNSKKTNSTPNFITIPNHGKRNIYIAYVEHPWSIEHIEKLTKSASTRTKSMQLFSISGKIESCIDNKKIFKIKTIAPNLVENYSADKTSSSLDKYNFLFKRYNNENLSNVNKIEIYKSAAEINKKTYNTAVTDPYGIAVMINDEIDIIDQLRLSRNAVYDHLNRKILETEGDNGLRDLCWLQALQQLEQGIKLSFDNRIECKQKEIPQEEIEAYKIENTKLQLALKVKTGNIEKGMLKTLYGYSEEEVEGKDNLDNWDYKAKHVLEQDSIITGLKQQRNKAIEQFDRCYNKNKRKYLENHFHPTFSKIESEKLQLDYNYCAWFKYGILKALDRLDQTNIQYSMAAVEIINRLLDDGSIISQSSANLWSWLFEDSQENGASVLVRGCLLNHKKTYDQYTAQSKQDPLWSIDLLKAKHWYDIIKKGQKLYEKRADIKNKEFVSPAKAWKAGWDDFKKPYRLLQKASGNARIALWNKNYSKTYGNAIKPIILETELAFSHRQLLLAGIVDAGLEKDFVTKNLFSMKKNTITAEILYKAIERNAELAKKIVSYEIKEKYHPTMYKTSSAKGNIPLSKVTDNNIVHFWTAAEFPVAIVPSQESIDRAKAEASNLTAEGMKEAELNIINEQEKAANSLTTGKVYVSIGNLIMSGYSLLNAINDLAHDPHSIEKLWKTMGSFVGMCQSYSDIISSFYAYKTSIVASHDAKYLFADTATRYKMISNSLSKTLAIIGIIDGIASIIKAYNKYKNGGNTHDRNIEMTMGALSITGAILTIAVGAAVFLPVMLTLGVIFFGLCNSLIHLVPSNIENWVRRSIYGRDKKYVMGKSFANFEEEQSSLNMVIKGITIEGKIEKDFYIIEPNDPRYITPLIPLPFSPGTPPLECSYAIVKISYPANAQEHIIVKIKNSKNSNYYLSGKINTYENKMSEINFVESPVHTKSNLHTSKTLSLKYDNESDDEDYKKITIKYLIDEVKYTENFKEIILDILTEDEFTHDTFRLEI